MNLITLFPDIKTPCLEHFPPWIEDDAAEAELGKKEADFEAMMYAIRTPDPSLALPLSQPVEKSTAGTIAKGILVRDEDLNNNETDDDEELRQEAPL